MENLVRLTPRISLNKLGEYMAASPRRRKTILQDQKYPRTAIVAQYATALEGIARLLSDRDAHASWLPEELLSLRETSSGTFWEKRRRLLCAQAMERFAELLPFLKLEGWEILRPDLRQSASLSIAGVHVSVRPEVLMSQRSRHGLELRGAVKLSLSKCHGLSEPCGDCVTSVLREWLEQQGGPSRRAERQHCMVVDVFRGRVYQAPGARKGPWRDVLAACTEIARLWPEICAPDGLADSARADALRSDALLSEALATPSPRIVQTVTLPSPTEMPENLPGDNRRRASLW